MVCEIEIGWRLLVALVALGLIWAAVRVPSPRKSSSLPFDPKSN